MLVSLVNHIRRNHALEHATINLITQRYPRAHILGLSGPLGFTLYTSLAAEDVIPVARQALQQLQLGDNALRVHQHCGTNLVVTATLTMLATLLGVGRRREKRLERLPHAVLLNVLALLAARPLGDWVQAHVTTSADLAGVEIASFFTDHQSGRLRIRVHTRQV